MDEPKFNDLLKMYADAPVPALPGSFTQDVLREIRFRKAGLHSDESWLSEIYGLLFKPGLLAGTFSVAVLVGLMYPAVMASPNSTTAARSLGLGVFSRSTGHLLSEVLANEQ